MAGFDKARFLGSGVQHGKGDLIRCKLDATFFERFVHFLDLLLVIVGDAYGFDEASLDGIRQRVT